MYEMAAHRPAFKAFVRVSSHFVILHLHLYALCFNFSVNHTEILLNSDLFHTLCYFLLFNV